MPETHLDPTHFLPHVGKDFRVRGGPHALTLTQVDRRLSADHKPTSMFRSPFNLIFCGSPSEVLDEGLYIFDVDDGVSFEIYLNPIHTATTDRQDYQAAFN
jgi:hypothetical protein